MKNECISDVLQRELEICLKLLFSCQISTLICFKTFLFRCDFLFQVLMLSVVFQNCYSNVNKMHILFAPKPSFLAVLV